MNTYEVTFCYGPKRGNGHNEVVRAKTPTAAITRAAKAIKDGDGGSLVRGNIDEINATLYEVLVRQLGA